MRRKAVSSHAFTSKLLKQKRQGMRTAMPITHDQLGPGLVPHEPGQMPTAGIDGSKSFMADGGGGALRSAGTMDNRHDYYADGGGGALYMDGPLEFHPMPHGSPSGVRVPHTPLPYDNSGAQVARRMGLLADGAAPVPPPTSSPFDPRERIQRQEDQALGKVPQPKPGMREPPKAPPPPPKRSFFDVMKKAFFDNKVDGGQTLLDGGLTQRRMGPEDPTGTKDKELAWVSPKEYVLPKDTVDAVGRENLDRLRVATHDFVHPENKPRVGLRDGGFTGVGDRGRTGEYEWDGPTMCHGGMMRYGDGSPADMLNARAFGMQPDLSANYAGANAYQAAHPGVLSLQQPSSLAMEQAGMQVNSIHNMNQALQALPQYHSNKPTTTYEDIQRNGVGNYITSASVPPTSPLARDPHDYGGDSVSRKSLNLARPITTALGAPLSATTPAPMTPAPTNPVPKQAWQEQNDRLAYHGPGQYPGPNNNAVLPAHREPYNPGSFNVARGYGLTQFSDGGYRQHNDPYYTNSGFGLNNGGGLRRNLPRYDDGGWRQLGLPGIDPPPPPPATASAVDPWAEQFPVRAAPVASGPAVPPGVDPLGPVAARAGGNAPEGWWARNVRSRPNVNLVPPKGVVNAAAAPLRYAQKALPYVGVGLEGLATARDVNDIRNDPEALIPHPLATARVAEGAGRLASGYLGGQAGAALGALGGPAAPFTMPAGAVLGGVAGFMAPDLIEKGLRYFNPDLKLPSTRIAEDRPPAAPAAATPPASAPPATPPTAMPATGSPAREMQATGAVDSGYGGGAGQGLRFNTSDPVQARRDQLAFWQDQNDRQQRDARSYEARASLANAERFLGSSNPANRRVGAALLAGVQARNAMAGQTEQGRQADQAAQVTGQGQRIGALTNAYGHELGLRGQMYGADLSLMGHRLNNMYELMKYNVALGQQNRSEQDKVLEQQIRKPKMNEKGEVVGDEPDYARINLIKQNIHDKLRGQGIDPNHVPIQTIHSAVQEYEQGPGALARAAGLTPEQGPPVSIHMRGAGEGGGTANLWQDVVPNAAANPVSNARVGLRDWANQYNPILTGSGQDRIFRVMARNGKAVDVPGTALFQANPAAGAYAINMMRRTDPQMAAELERIYAPYLSAARGNP